MVWDTVPAKPPPTIACRPLELFAADNLTALRSAFAGATRIPLGQAWLDAPEPGFAPAIVRTGWRGDTLCVFAELTDTDIFTRAERHNDRFWELGDTFEIFLQPLPGPAYVEFHVTPSNLRLQLRFAAPPPPRPAAADDPFERSLLRRDAFRSSTWLDPAAGVWCVLAEIPAPAVTGTAAGPSGAAVGLAGSAWRASFGRYDYTRGRAEPVISSSSPHTEPRFHRPHEWSVLQFVA